MFFKIDVGKYFGIFPGKHKKTFFSNKVTGLRPVNLQKRDSNTGVFL